MIERRVPPAEFILLRLTRVRSGSDLWSSALDRAMMVLSGVRISWLMLAMKAVLASEEASAWRASISSVWSWKSRRVPAMLMSGSIRGVIWMTMLRGFSAGLNWMTWVCMAGGLVFTAMAKFSSKARMSGSDKSPEKISPAVRPVRRPMWGMPSIFRK